MTTFSLLYYYFDHNSHLDSTHQALSAARKKHKPPPGYSNNHQCQNFCGYPHHSFAPLSSSADKRYSLCDLTTLSQIFWLVPSNAPFTSLAIHPDGTLLALCIPTSTIQIYDVHIGVITATGHR